MPPEKIKISIVNYTNTLPFKWALKGSELINKIDLQEDIPSICAQKLKFGQVDLALVPVALIVELDHYFIETDFCIGADGSVDSVKLYSDVPLHEMGGIMLDYQSKSSITLTKVLCKFFWKLDVPFFEARPGFENEIKGHTGAVVIGDRTFEMNGNFKFEYDLASEWKKFTGLPFVFAAWLSREKLPGEFIASFNKVLTHGVIHTRQAIDESEVVKGLTREMTHHYLTKKIDYKLDQPKREALKRFLSYMGQL